MKLLITGASGFIASHIAKAAHSRGYELTLLDKSFGPEQKRFWAERVVRTIESDVQDFNGTLELDAVIHAAALTAEPAELNMTPETYLKVSLNINFHMLNWSRSNGVKRFIFISSAGVFSSTQQGRLDENAAPLSKGLYALSKRSTEDLMTHLNVEGAYDFISVRLGNVYGEAEYSKHSRPRVSLFQRMLNKATTQGSISVPNESPRDWTYAGDIAKLFVHLLETKSPKELYHFVSDESFTALELAQKIQHLLPEVTLKRNTEPETQLRAPLKTNYLSELNFSNWTPFDRGLEHVIRAQQIPEVSA